MGSSEGGVPQQERFRRAARSQSEVVGVVLILGMVILGAFAILALGATAIGDTESQLSEDRAEKTLTQFDSKAGLVALGEANSQEVYLPSGSDDEFSVTEDTGEFRIEIINRTTRETADWADPLIKVDLGAVEFESENGKLAYQGGGVFRGGESNGTMVSPPEFHFRDGTLTIPIINITGERSLGSSATITHSNETKVFPLTGEEEYTNPLDNHEVKVVVESEYYEGWGQYFDQRTDGSVEYIHEDEKVVLILRTPVGEQTVQEAVAATAAGGDLTLTGDGTVDYNSDSYNSTDGTYEETRTGNGNISIAGTFDVRSGVKVNGSVEAGTEARCSGNPTIDGTLVAESFDDFGECQDAAEEGASQESISTFDDGLNVEAYVEEEVADIKADPSSSENITADDRIDFDNGEATLGPGRYYLDKFTVDDDKLILDTGDSDDIDIAVENYVQLADADVNITGTGEVNVLINGSEKVSYSGGGAGTNDYDLLMEDATQVKTEGDIENSTQFWIYGKDSFEAMFDGGQNDKPPILEGVVYAPTLTGQPSEMSNVTLNGATVYGGIVAGDVTSDHSSIHFDKALEEEQAVPEDTRVATITYLHITENEIEID